AVKGQRAGRRPPAVVVLFSDGGQTAGRISPQQAAAKAKKARIPVSALAVGTVDGIVRQPLRGGFFERFQVPVQPAVLRTIAQGSGGRYARLRDVDVKGVYRALGSRVGRQDKQVEVTAVAAAGGIALMLAGALRPGLWFRRLP